jgi:phytol kinase
VLSVFIALIVVAYAEGYFKTKKLSPEVARKLVHVAHGLVAATWPFFVSMRTIIIVEILFIFAVTFARVFNLFPDLRSVYRLTWGEFFFPLGVIGVALLNPGDWIFAAAMLHLGLADSAAAVVGTKFGKHRYKVFGHDKSIEGSLAFWVVSFVITAWVVFFSPIAIAEQGFVLLMLPLLATASENIGVFGIDNLFIPILVASMLQLAAV